MRAKDLHVGMCVAVKSGSYSARKAWVLEIGTQWYCAFVGDWRRRPVDTKTVAVAFSGRHPGDTCDPSVVKPAQILGLWDEYIVGQSRQQAASQLAYEKAQRREQDYQARFEKLNLGEHAELEKNGWVRLPLDVLEERLGDETTKRPQSD